RLHRGRPRSNGRAPHQRRRLARARRHACLRPRCDRHRARRQIRRLCRPDRQSGVEQILCRRSRQDECAMTSSASTAASEPHPLTGQPVGLPVANPTGGPRPGPVTLKGRYGRLEKLRPDHWSDLWAVFAGHDHVWTYIATGGPFATASEFSAYIAMRAAADDPYAYAIVDPQDRAIGYVTLLRIVPINRAIEVGHVLYSPA